MQLPGCEKCHFEWLISSLIWYIWKFWRRSKYSLRIYIHLISNQFVPLKNIKYCVFSLKFCDFSELCQFMLQRWCSTSLVCVHTLAPRENRVRNISKSSEKNTIFNEHPVYKIGLQTKNQNMCRSVVFLCIRLYFVFLYMLERRFRGFTNSFKIPVTQQKFLPFFLMLHIFLDISIR